MTSKDYLKLLKAFEKTEKAFEPFKGLEVLHAVNTGLRIANSHRYLLNQMQRLENLESLEKESKRKDSGRSSR